MTHAIANTFVHAVVTLGAVLFLWAGYHRWQEIDTEVEMAEYLNQKES